MKAACQKDKLSDISPAFREKLKCHALSDPVLKRIEILQMNITKKCNLNCRHCHVKSSMQIEEHMNQAVMSRCIEVAALDSVSAIDITGGAPEMHPMLGELISSLSSLGKKIIVRTNLTILGEDPYKKYIDIYADNKITLVGSLPFYIKQKYEIQRGPGNFEKSIGILKQLNSTGYGKKDSGLVLDLVHNPSGAFLAADQKTMESEYRKNLKDIYGIDFNTLFSITNMPIGRFLEYLLDTGNFTEYSEDLVNAFNPLAVENAMCTGTLNIAPDGSIFNCDFNQMLELPAFANGKNNILDISDSELNNISVATHNHCYGCTAGSGSSCQGTTV